MIKRIAHVCIFARDLDRAESFYCEGLGFEKVFRFMKKGKQIGFYMRAGVGTYVEVFQKDAVDPESAGPIGHACFEVSDIDELSARLAGLDCEATPKRLGADRSWQVWCRDPSGIRVEFHQYTDESSQLTGRDCEVNW